MDQHVDTAPSVAMAPDGRFVVGWLGSVPGRIRTLFARTYDAAGEAVADVFQVNGAGGVVNQHHRPEPDESSRPLDLGMNGDGNIVAVWSAGDGPFSAVLRRFDEQGRPLTDDVQVSAAGRSVNLSPAVAVAGCFDNHVVAWQDDDEANVDHALYLADDDGEGDADQCCSP